jgi:hypothetical protein
MHRIGDFCGCGKLTVLLALLATGTTASAGEPAAAETPPAADPGPMGMWIWNRESWDTPDARRALFEFLDAHRISLIMVQVATDYSGPAPALKHEPEMHALLADAAKHKVDVHALDGDPEMIFEPGPARLEGQIRAVAAFNARLRDAAPEAGPGFAGVHYDIEPHALPRFRDPATRASVCDAYLALLDRLGPVARAQRLAFSVDIPFWLDTRADLPTYEHGGAKETLLDQVARRVDWFGVMAYRNVAAGPNGVLDVSRGEVEAAAKYGRRAWVGVEFGMETGDDPPKITFWNRTPEDAAREIAAVRRHYMGAPGYGGLLIHSYEQYRKWEKK